MLNNTCAEATGSALACDNLHDPTPVFALTASLVGVNPVTHGNGGVFTSLEVTCTYELDNDTVVWGDFINATPFSLSNGVNVTLAWVLPPQFSPNGTTAGRVVLGGVEATIFDAFYDGVRATAGSGRYTARTDVWVFDTRGRVLTYARHRVLYATPSVLNVDSMLGADIPADSGSDCVACDTEYGCASIKCAVRQATRADTNSSTTINLAPRRYEGPNNVRVYFGGAPITLAGILPGDQTVVDCAGAPGPAFVFDSRIGQLPARLAALTIQNCTAEDGGGIQIANDAFPLLKVGGLTRACEEGILWGMSSLMNFLYVCHDRVRAFVKLLILPLV